MVLESSGFWKVLVLVLVGSCGGKAAFNAHHKMALFLSTLSTLCLIGGL